MWLLSCLIALRIGTAGAAPLEQAGSQADLRVGAFRWSEVWWRAAGPGETGSKRTPLMLSRPSRIYQPYI